MTSSEKNTQTTDSPSNPSPPAPASTSPQPLSTPPLRVAPPVPAPPSPTLSLTTAPGSAPGFDPVDHADPGNTRSSPDGGGGNVGRFDAKSIKDIARGLVLLGSRQVHSTLARTEQEQAEDVWVARSEDQKQIADPLASIAQRHGAIDAPPDIVNLIEAGLGLLAYVVYHAGKAWTIRRGLRKLRGVDPINPQETS